MHRLDAGCALDELGLEQAGVGERHDLVQTLSGF
jgi:hypothetical protein